MSRSLYDALRPLVITRFGSCPAFPRETLFSAISVSRLLTCTLWLCSSAALIASSSENCSCAATLPADNTSMNDKITNLIVHSFYDVYEELPPVQYFPE